MRIFNKFVWSKKAPKNENDIWFDGSVWKMFSQGEWEAFTVEKEAATKINKLIEDSFRVYQEKLTAGKGIKIENNTISTTSLFSIVNYLPDIGEENIIYLLYSTEAEDKNKFVEYIWLSNKWEKLGEFKADIDLSPYLTKTEAQGIYQPQEKGKGLSSNDYTTAEKNKLSSLENYDDSGLRAELSRIDTAKASKEDVEELSERIAENDVLIEDLQNTKIDKEADDYYPQLAVGLADNLSGVDVVDSEVNFRRSGGGAISDGVARIEAIKGNSLVWNQKWSLGVRQGVIDNTDGTSPKYASLGLIPWYTSAINGHKILTIANDKKGEIDRVYWNDQIQNDVRGGAIYEAKTSQTTGSSLTARCPANTIANYDTTILLFDLTQMFGSGNEPTTIDEFYSRIPQGVDLNAYNEGEVIHMDVQSIESQGVNAWDEEWEIGAISGTNGENIDMSTRMRSKNYIPLIPFKAYYANIAFGNGVFFYDDKKEFITRRYSISTIPQNARYMRFVMPDDKGTTYNNDICINLSDTSINGKYFPYVKRTEDLSIIRKYFPQGMKSAGTAHDEIRYNKASGKWEMVQRIGEDNMWELDWGYVESSAMFYVGNSDKYYRYMGLLTTEYPNRETSTVPKKIFAVTGVLRLSDPSYTDVVTFKAMLQEKQMKLYYELAEPIVTELDAEDQNFRDYYNVADFGTEMSQSSVPSAPFSADIIYQFNAVDMIREHELEITELQNVIATMQAQLTALINGVA